MSDGKFSNIAKINIKFQENSSNFRFQKNLYQGYVVENNTKISVVTVVDVLGTNINDHIFFKILTNNDFFEIGNTSGVIKTTGRQVDREEVAFVELIVAAYGISGYGTIEKVAHVIANITIVDINDNCPVFLEAPYYTYATTNHPKGTILTRVHAIDLDTGENGEVS